MYRVQPGDTYDGISRKLYGVGDRAAVLKAANPGVGDPPQAGAVLFAPADGPPRPPPTAQGDLVTIMIGDRVFAAWERVTVIRSMDVFSTFVFESVWEPDDPEHRHAFRPFQYQGVAVFDGPDVLLTGTMIDATPTVTSNSSTITAAGYATPGVLNDCTAPLSALPLESEKRTLAAIARDLLDIFGLRLVMPDPGPIFDRESIKPEQRVLDYLETLATQRRMIITDTVEGYCKIYTETPSPPVAQLSVGDWLSVEPAFSGQEYYSSITGRSPTAVLDAEADAGAAFTAPNPKLQGQRRPFTFTAEDTDGGTLPAAVRAKLGRMHGNTVEYNVRVAGWRTEAGKMWAPGDYVTLHAPSAMIYSPYTFLIREVRYDMDATSKIATLSLVLPGAFSGAVPEVMPWEE